VVALTAEGRTLVDGLVEQHVANEHRLVSGLSEKERAQLARLLEAWGRALDELED
jgi:DNA-binding MarR family transcriptional regulator